ncbi:endonuclease III [Novosphingobium sp. MW5]|nr:endonuclease III [Novosphingobium sp. MW5]
MAGLTKGQTERLAAAVRTLGAHYPEAHCALRGADSEFTLLMGLLLTQRTRTEVAEQALASLASIARTPDQLATIGVERIITAISGVAYPVSKASRLVQLSFALNDRHGGIVPEDQKELEDLPGIGPKIARLFLNLAHNEPTIAFDSHVLRLCRRLTGSSCSRAADFEHALSARLNAEESVRAHHWMIEHARTVCQTRKPKCGACQVANQCTGIVKRAPDKRSAQ